METVNRHVVLAFLSLICAGVSAEIQQILEINKCSDSLEFDTLELPSSWFGSGNQSDNQSGYDEWVQFSLVEHDPCEQHRRHVISVSFDNSTTDYFSHNGYFRGGSVYYPPNAYCISNLTDEKLDVQICIPNCDKDLCFPKCCPPGKVFAHDLNAPFTKEAGNCTTVEEDWSPFLYQMLNSTHGKKRLKNSTLPYLPYYSVWTPQNCQIVGASPHDKVPTQNYNEILVMDSGHVYMRPKSETPGGWHASRHNQFCIDGLWDTSSTNEFILDENNQVIWTCQEPKKSGSVINFTIVRVMFGFFCVATLSLLLAFLAFALLWDGQNAHGWSITMFCFAAMMDWGIFGGGLGVVLYHHRFVNTFGCKFMGVLGHFFHMATFSWMNVLCFDIWTAIRSLTAISLRSRGRKRFALYCCYGFGTPFIIVAISLGIQHHIPLMITSIVRPDYGAMWCGVSAYSRFYYATLVSGVMYSFNLLFGYFIFKSLREITRASQQDDKSSTKHKAALGILFVKLCLLMGPTLILDFILFFLEGKAVRWLHIMVVFITALRGIALASVFLSDLKIRRQLLDKFYIFAAFISQATDKYKFQSRSSVKVTSGRLNTRNSRV